MSELVSIIMPAYNAGSYIEDSIKSVVNQSYSDWELIIVDDCSKDMTREIVKEYQQKDNRIKLVSLEQNSGVSMARNTGIRIAKGKYIAFLDSDDLWYASKLAKQLQFMIENNYIFTYSSYDLINNNGRKLNKIIKVPKVINYEKLLHGNSIGCLTVVINAEKIPMVEMPNIKHEDYATWLTILRNGTLAYGLDETLASYRKSTGSVSSNKLKAVGWTWNIYKNNQELGVVKALKYLTMYIINTTVKYLR